MRVDVISVLPEIFEPVMSASMLGIARDRGALEFHAHDLRDWALPGVHRQVDDAPYGGGPGMVMRPEPLFAAIRAVHALDDRPAFTVLMTPQGVPFSQRLAEELAERERLVLVCGRYEGIDERVRAVVDLQVSVGDYVLTGGELPAMVIIDAVSRLLPGVLGDDASVQEESFTWGLLEYPHYTRPASFEGADVPDVLLSGDHARIARWRREQAIVRTARLRPDLLEAADLTPAERVLADRALEAGGPDQEEA
jgi:tRNA (guanine37-N1)-methyltransferase